jgi:hypothetical protein
LVVVKDVAWLTNNKGNNMLALDSVNHKNLLHQEGFEWLRYEELKFLTSRPNPQIHCEEYEDPNDFLVTEELDGRLNFEGTAPYWDVPKVGIWNEALDRFRRRSFDFTFLEFINLKVDRSLITQADRLKRSYTSQIDFARAEKATVVECNYELVLDKSTALKELDKITIERDELLEEVQNL